MIWYDQSTTLHYAPLCLFWSAFSPLLFWLHPSLLYLLHSSLWSQLFLLHFSSLRLNCYNPLRFILSNLFHSTSIISSRYSQICLNIFAWYISTMVHYSCSTIYCFSLHFYIGSDRISLHQLVLYLSDMFLDTWGILIFLLVFPDIYVHKSTVT